jgi:hypothetical protein
LRRAKALSAPKRDVDFNRARGGSKDSTDFGSHFPLRQPEQDLGFEQGRSEAERERLGRAAEELVSHYQAEPAAASST